MTKSILDKPIRKKLQRGFYNKPTLMVARDLLGKYLVRKIGQRELSGMITETEAYIGPKDRASHAYGNRITERNRAEYLIGGHIYIYLVYGMYWQLNITTDGKGKPECVLIRALDIGNKSKKTDGPGKLCRYLKLDKSFYGEDLIKSKRIWVEDRGEGIASLRIKAGPRVGIDYAGPYWSKRKWRFYFEKL